MPTITVTAKSDPFGRDPSGASQFYETTGRVLMLWGRLESALDALRQNIVHSPQAATIRNSERVLAPVSMGRRLRLLHRCFTEIHELASHKEAAVQLIGAIRDAYEDRVALVHSAWNGFVSTDPLTLEAKQISHKGGTITFKTYRITLNQLNAALSTVDRLNVRLLPFLWNLSMFGGGPIVPPNSE